MTFSKSFIQALIFCGVCLTHNAYSEDGYRLWLRYDLIADPTFVNDYIKSTRFLTIQTESPELKVARQELELAIKGLLGKPVTMQKDVQSNGTIVLGTPGDSKIIAALNLEDKLKSLGDEGFLLLSTTINGKQCIVITGNSDVGVLYGTFHFISLLQTQKSIRNLLISSLPKIKHRILNHWDNLDRTVERGYAGFSLWDWHKLPDYIDPRYYDYARANASVGINGTVVTNVNANAQALTEQ